MIDSIGWTIIPKIDQRGPLWFYRLRYKVGTSILKFNAKRLERNNGTIA